MYNARELGAVRVKANTCTRRLRWFGEPKWRYSECRAGTVGEARFLYVLLHKPAPPCPRVHRGRSRDFFPAKPMSAAAGGDRASRTGRSNNCRGGPGGSASSSTGTGTKPRRNASRSGARAGRNVRPPTRTDCSTRVEAVVAAYMKSGWTALTGLFQAGTSCKEKTLVVKKNDSVGAEAGAEDDREFSLPLKLLSAVREYVVHDAFRCARPGPGTTYSAHGSTHITSDYDVSVQGRDASRVVWDMFLRFWNMYRLTLDQSFDTNLYCVPFFAAAGMHPALRKHCALLGQGETAVFVSAAADYPTVLPAAAAKLLGHARPLALAWKQLPRVSALLAAAQEFTSARDAELAAAAAAAPADVKDAPDAHRTYARYSLQCAHGAAALRMLYAPPKTRVSAAAFLESLVRASYFAVEAYYTPDAVNVVVVGLQRREQVKCEPLSYVCSALENLGDLRSHAIRATREARRPAQRPGPGGAAEDPRVRLLKYSKYVHRILHSLEGFAARASQSTVRAAWYEEHVLRYRACGDVGQVPWSAAGYRAGTPVATYVDGLTAQVLGAVETFMEAQDMRF